MKIETSKFNVMEGRARHSWPTLEGGYKTKFVDEMTKEDWAEVDQFIMAHFQRIRRPSNEDKT